MTPTQIALARHALGLPNKRRTSYRNFYTVKPSTPDHAGWLAMAAAGEAVCRLDQPAFCGLSCFWLTPDGAKAALKDGEKLDLEDFPAKESA